MMNAINVIRPYKFGTLWVFDDPNVGLDKEPFVAGIDKLVDQLTAHIPNAHTGFLLLFSATPFPEHQHILERLAEDKGGWWYTLYGTDSHGWLCPALFRYFEEAPEQIHIAIYEDTTP